MVSQSVQLFEVNFAFEKVWEGQMQFLGLVIFDLTVCECASCILKMHRLRKKCNIRLFFITCCISAERRRDRRSTNVCLNKHFLAVGLAAALWGMLFFFQLCGTAIGNGQKCKYVFKVTAPTFLELQVSGSISLNQVLSVIHFFISTLSTTQMGPRKI